MGRETTCIARWKGRRSEGKALLETDAVIFRGDFRLELPFAALTRLSAGRGVLTLGTAAGTLTLDVGDEAARWAEKIRHPPTLADKLGLRPGQHVAIVGLDDASLVETLRSRAGRVTEGRLAKGADMIVAGLARAADLQRFDRLRDAVAPDGAIWTVRPKGVAEVSEAAVRAAARAAGLVDVKVARVSATHTAEKFVIPKEARERRTPNVKR